MVVSVMGELALATAAVLFVGMVAAGVRIGPGPAGNQRRSHRPVVPQPAPEGLILSNLDREYPPFRLPGQFDFHPQEQRPWDRTEAQ